MSFVKTGAFRGLNSDSDDVKIDSSGNVAIVNGNIVNKNLIINGGMNVWQRATSQASISSTSTDGYVTADRWTTYNNSLGTWTQSQSTDVPTAQGFGYSLKMDCTTADASPAAGDELVITQKIEAQNLQHLLYGSSSPKSITLSFWVKSNKTGTYIINLVRTDGGTRSISKSYTISSANTWEKKEINFGGDTTNAIANDNGSGIDINFYLAAGSTYTSGTLATSWESYTAANRAVGQVNLADSTSNEWYMTGCQLEVGENASGFEFEPYQIVLRKCQRYYETGKINISSFGQTGSTDTHAYQLAHFAEQKRVVPSITKSNASFTTLSISGSAQWTNLTTSDAYDDEQIHGFTAGSKVGTSAGTAILKANYDFAADSEL